MMGRPLKTPKPPPATELKRLARLAAVLTVDPTNAKANAQLSLVVARAARRSDRLARAQAQAQAKAKRESRAKAKVELEAKRESRAQAKVELEALREAKREARASRLAQIEARRAARAQRVATRAKRLDDAAARQERAYLWAQRKAEIADRKANRDPYLREQKRLLEEEPWTLVERQQDIVEIAGRRVVQLRLDTRAALAVSGPDDPETVVEYQRLVKETKSALNSRQYETRRFKRYERIARDFDLKTLV